MTSQPRPPRLTLAATYTTTPSGEWTVAVVTRHPSGRTPGVTA